MSFYKKIIPVLMLMILLVSVVRISAQTEDQSAEIKISDTPTLSEISNEFLLAKKGKHDLYSVLGKIASKKDNSVNALNELLFSSMVNEIGRDKAAKEKPDKQYAIMALEAIGTPAAKNVLYTAALRHSDKELRGVALNLFAWNIYYRARNDESEPGKEILHLFINNADDTTYIKAKGKRLGEIAREGIKNWTGEDYGSLPNEHLAIKSKRRNEKLGIEEYRERWWQKNKKNIIWNKETQHFEVKTK